MIAVIRVYYYLINELVV